MDVFVDVFGGSASVLIARKPHKLEVYNDRFTGLTDFYRCVRDHCDELVARLNLIINSREEWEWCKAHWNEPDPYTAAGRIERAARWYYCIQMSYGGIDRAWYRSLLLPNRYTHQYAKKLKLFPILHERFRGVQVENLDWFQCMIDYDSPGTVFYLDPPYLDQDNNHYKHVIDHKSMLDSIFKMKGFVALSGYPTPLYEEHPWTARHEWQRPNKLRGGLITEVLWIKE